MRGKLNGIGFAQKLNLEVDSAEHLVVRDVSLQGSTLSTCPVHRLKVCQVK